MSLTLEEYKNLDTYLLYELGMAGALNENKLRKLAASHSILNESVEDIGLPDILLQEYTVTAGDGKKYDLPSLQVSYNSGSQIFTIKHGISKPAKELRVSPSEIENLWSDLSIETTKEFFARLGVPSFEIGLRPESSIAKAVSNRIHFLYNDKYARNNDDVDYLPDWKKRRSYYESQAAGNANNSGGQGRRPNFDENNLDPGRRGSTSNSKTIKKINNEEILSGSFYRDRSQIKRSRLSRLLKYLKKDYDNQSTRSYGPFRVWKKTFLLGYKVSSKMHFEVWYNSYDSTFSVYDMNGVEKTEGVPTLQEAVRFLIRIIAQESPDDRDILSANSAGRDLSRSIQNAMSQAITPELKQKMNDDDQAEREARAEARRNAQEKSNSRTRAEKKQDRAKDAGERTRRDRSGEESISDRWRRAQDNKAKEKERRRQRAEREAGEEFAGTYEKNRDEETVRDAFRNAQRSAANSADRDEKQADDSNKKMKGDDRGRITRDDTVKARDTRAEDVRREREERNASDSGPVPAGDGVNSRKTDGRFRRINASYDIKGMIHDAAADTKKTLTEAKTNRQQYDLDGREFDNIADQIKRQAQKSGYTRQMLINDINNSVEYYYKTRTEKRSFLRKTLDATTSVFRRRNAPVENPMDEAFFRKLGNTLIGRKERADFIIGFTMNDILNVEIWYITEYDEDQDKYVSSFYVYDVEASKYIRTNLPYYRNAMTVVGQKMSVMDTDSFAANNQYTNRR